MPRIVRRILIGVVLAAAAVGIRYAVVNGLFTGALALGGTGSARLKTSPAFHAAAQAVSLNPEILDAVGQPMTFGDAAVKRDGEDELSLDLQIHGASGEGHALVDLLKPTRKHGWLVKGGDFFAAKPGPPIRIGAQQPR